MKGKIPVTGNIQLETGEEHWTLLVRGLINELQISGIIEIEPNKRVRIRMIIKEIYPPERLSVKNICFTGGSFDAAASGGLNRINEHLSNFLESKKWVMIGEIQGEVNVPIVLVHYCLIEMSFYAQKTKSESAQNFFPTMGPIMPSAN